MWYEIALEYWGSLAVRARDVVAEKMTPKQVAEAERRAGEWRRAHQKPKAEEQAAISAALPRTAQIAAFCDRSEFRNGDLTEVKDSK